MSSQLAATAAADRSEPDVQPRSEGMAELLYPWFELPDAGLPRAEAVAAQALPQPARSLLAHAQDMTSTLERFHDQAIDLRVLYRERSDELLRRRVILVGREHGRPVELGAILIHLQRFPAAARPAVRDGVRPLGAVLAEFQIDYQSQPAGFFRLWPDAKIGHALGLHQSCALYGRRNALLDRQGLPLAEVVEVLPPAAPADPTDQATD